MLANGSLKFLEYLAKQRQKTGEEILTFERTWHLDKEISVSVGPYTTNGEVTISFRVEDRNWTEINKVSDIPTEHFERIAELRRHVEAWKSGEIEELWPSSGPPKEDA